MPHIFTYGSLMFDPVWSKVVTGLYERKPAMLSGYCRYAVVAEEYPAMIASGKAADKVRGVVYFDISSRDLLHLDSFEGQYYYRHEVDVVLPEGELMKADTYILCPEFHHILSSREWNVDEFRKQGITRFLGQYVGFNDK